MAKIKIGDRVFDTAAILRGDFANRSFRKSFKVSEMVAILRVLEPQFREEAKERQRLGGSEKIEQGQEERGEARVHIAKLLGTSRVTLGKAERVVIACEKYPADTELQQILDWMDYDGKIDSAYRRMQIVARAKGHDL